MSTTAIRLHRIMYLRGVGQKQLATAVGCSQVAISKILSGDTMRSHFLPAIARYLDVSFEWLRGAQDEDLKLVEVGLPSEAALRLLFQAMLAQVPRSATTEELAELLARRLADALKAVPGVHVNQAAPETDAACGRSVHLDWLVRLNVNDVHEIFCPW